LGAQTGTDLTIPQPVSRVYLVWVNILLSKIAALKKSLNLPPQMPSFYWHFLF